MSLASNTITIGTKSRTPMAYTVKIAAGQNITEIDFRSSFQDLSVKEIQSVYIDNSLNTSGISLNVNGSGQTINIQGSLQGFYPLIMPSNGDVVTINTNSSTGTVTIIFTNIYIASGFTYNSNSGLNVKTDSNDYLYVNLATSSLTSSLPVSVNNQPNSATNPIFADITNAVLAISATTAANSATNPIYTEEINSTGFHVGTATQSTITASTLIPARSGITGFIDKITIIETSNATLTTAGIVNLEIIDGATTIASIPVYVPATALSGSYAPITLDLKYNQLAADSALTVNLSAALATGEFYLIANYK